MRVRANRGLFVFGWLLLIYIENLYIRLFLLCFFNFFIVFIDSDVKFVGFVLILFLFVSFKNEKFVILFNSFILRVDIVILSVLILMGDVVVFFLFWVLDV